MQSRLNACHLGGESGQHEVVALARASMVEGASPNDPQALTGSVLVGRQIGSSLAGRIGIQWLEERPLGHRLSVGEGAAVHVRRAHVEHQTLGASPLRALQQVESALQIDTPRYRRLSETGGHMRLRGQMDDNVGANLSKQYTHLSATTNIQQVPAGDLTPPMSGVTLMVRDRMKHRIGPASAKCREQMTPYEATGPGDQKRSGVLVANASHHLRSRRCRSASTISRIMVSRDVSACHPS